MTEPERLSLARLPTPIHRLERLSAEAGRELFVWRDDLTGCVESGNKVRKIEFLLAEAVAGGATWIVTCGAPQSNHARATVVLARRLGLGVTVLVREPAEGRDSDAPWTGNWLLMNICGAASRSIPFETYRDAGSTYGPFLAEEAAALRGRGERPYVVDEGGSSPLGCFGYRHAVGEMLETWSGLGLGDQGPDALFFALGSGGTHAGLVLGYEKHGLDASRLCAVNVCNDRRYFEQRVGNLITETCERFGLPSRERTLRIFDGHVGGGYSQATDDDLRFYARVAERDGILLDPCYTGKAFRGMLAELEREPGAFGERILFLHSGGAFSLSAYAERFRGVLGRADPLFAQGAKGGEASARPLPFCSE